MIALLSILPSNMKHYVQIYSYATDPNSNL